MALTRLLTTFPYARHGGGFGPILEAAPFPCPGTARCSIALGAIRHARQRTARMPPLIRVTRRNRGRVAPGESLFLGMFIANESSDPRPIQTDTGVTMVSSFVGSVPIGVIIDAILFGTALLTMAAARFLPEHHLSTDKGVASVSAAVSLSGCFGAGSRPTHIKFLSASFTAKSRRLRRYRPM